LPHFHGFASDLGFSPDVMKKS
ncbi:hypothetical protein CMV_010458, partial [Castanea mollissima]